MIRLFGLAAFAILRLAAEGMPCIAASSGCTEWITYRTAAARSLVYRNYPLEAPNIRITRALVIVHDAGRAAEDYFRTALAAAFLAGALEDTLIVAPRFASNDGRECQDALAPNEVSWPCNGDSWRSGGASPGHDNLTSFDFADEILRKLNQRGVFPNLRSIVIAGHSAGGQFVNRYEMANKIHDSLAAAVAYIVSNPSSYAYPHPLRPAPNGEFRLFDDRRNCTLFDNWPYGFEHRTGYTAKIGEDQLKKQLVSRPATYLLGEMDTTPLGGFDGSCPAMAQGPSRRARGEAFAKDVNENFGAHHQLVIVPLCGHNARCMFTSDVALPLLFPKN